VSLGPTRQYSGSELVVRIPDANRWHNIQASIFWLEPKNPIAKPPPSRPRRYLPLGIATAAAAPVVGRFSEGGQRRTRREDLLGVLFAVAGAGAGVGAGVVEAGVVADSLAAGVEERMHRVWLRQSVPH
jgi:hypothetical protein